MVRTYSQKNRFCRKTKLNERQTRYVLYRLFNLEKYEDINAKEDVSVNSISRLSSRLNQRISNNKTFRSALFVKMHRECPEICERIFDLENEEVPAVLESFWFCMHDCPHSFVPAHLSSREFVEKYYPWAPISSQSYDIQDEHEAHKKWVVTTLCNRCLWAEKLGVSREARDEILYLIYQSIEVHRMSKKTALNQIWRLYIASCIAYRATRRLFKKYDLDEIATGDIDRKAALKSSFNEFMNGLFNQLILDPL